MPFAVCKVLTIPPDVDSRNPVARHDRDAHSGGSFAPYGFTLRVLNACLYEAFVRIQWIVRKPKSLKFFVFNMRLAGSSTRAVWQRELDCVP
jgi:hypothetical protein